MHAARRSGVDTEYLGITELFASPRLYEGIDTDWVLAPAQNSDDAVMPARERRALQRLLTNGPIPPPATAIALSERLGQRSARIIRAAGRAAATTGAVAAGIAAAPVVLVGGALASLATLDPIVLGAIPALHSSPGQPAAFFVLARWDW